MTQLSTRPSIGGDILQARRRGGSVKHTYRDAVLDDHPIVFWPLDDPPGTVKARDLSGNGHSGLVAVGHQTLIFGVPGFTSDGATALRQASPFDSGDGIAVSSTAPALAVGTGAWTLEVAAGTYDVGDDPALIAVGVDGTPHQVWIVYRRPGVLWVDDDAGNDLRYLCGLDPALMPMQHYAVTYNGAGAFVAYANAVPLTLQSSNGTLTPNIVSPGLAVGGAIGGRWSGVETVADAAFYDYALTAAQIAAHVAAR